MVWIVVVWGLCFVGIRWGLRDAPVLWFAALRGLVAGAALLLLALWQRRPLPRGIRVWAMITVLGVVNVTIAFGAMFAGVVGLTTGAAAVLANAQPLLILLPAWWFYGEAVSARTAVALAVGFAGLLLVGLSGGGGSGAALSLLAAAGITGGTLLARRLAGADLLVVSGWHFVIGGTVLAVVAGTVEGVPTIAWTPRFMLILAFLSLIGSAAAFLAWFKEAARARLDVLSAWTFLVPVVSVAASVLILDEGLTVWTGVGTAVVLASMWIILRPGKHQVHTASADPRSHDGTSSMPPGAARKKIARLRKKGMASRG